MLLALVMYRAIFGRGLIRTPSLVPYGIVTVVAAFAWRLAFSGSRAASSRRSSDPDYDPPTHARWSLYVVAIFTEVWKTTPFMALLLLAGLTLVPDELHEAAQGRRRERVAALLEDHGAADEAGDPRRAAVPHARRVPDLRHGLLIPTAHNREHRDGLGCSATTRC